MTLKVAGAAKKTRQKHFFAGSSCKAGYSCAQPTLLLRHYPIALRCYDFVGASRRVARLPH